MKNKNLALVAVLFTISVIMAFANGPTPQVVIDTDQIVDGAVTAIKTDGSLAKSDLSNVPATSTLTIASATIPVLAGVTTINGVAPLTAAEKTQALVGSSTVDHYAKSSLYVSQEATTYGASRHVSFPNTILASGGTRTIKLTRNFAEARAFALQLVLSGYKVSIATPLSKNVSMLFAWAADGTISAVSSSTVNLGLGADIDVSLLASGTKELQVVLTNNAANPALTITAILDLVGGRGGNFEYSGVE